MQHKLLCQRVLSMLQDVTSLKWDEMIENLQNQLHDSEASVKWM